MSRVVIITMFTMMEMILRTHIRRASCLASSVSGPASGVHLVASFQSSSLLNPRKQLQPTITCRSVPPSKKTCCRAMQSQRLVFRFKLRGCLHHAADYLRSRPRTSRLPKVPGKHNILSSHISKDRLDLSLEFQLLYPAKLNLFGQLVAPCRDTVCLACEYMGCLE